MATPDVQRFYDERRAYSRGAVMNSVKYRQNHKAQLLVDGGSSFKGYPKTSVGSMNAMITDGNYDQSTKPFQPLPGISAQNPRALRGGFPFMALATTLLPSVISAFTGKGQPMTGGIRDMRNYKKVQQLIQQRAEDMNLQDNPTLPPTTTLTTLTEDDKLKIELNSLITRIRDLVTTNDYDPLTADVWRRLIVLLARVVPTLDSADTQDFLDFFDNMAIELQLDIGEKGNRLEDVDFQMTTRFKIVEGIRDYLKKMVGLGDRPVSEKALASKSFLKSSGISQPSAKKILTESTQLATELATELVREQQRALEAQRLQPANVVADNIPPLVDEEGNVIEAPQLGAVAQADNQRALSQLDALYNASSKQAKQASDELMYLYNIIFPTARTRRGALQVKRAVEDEIRNNRENRADLIRELEHLSNP